MKIFATIFRKEFIDTVRDRRTLFMMVIFPLLLFPLLLTAVTKLQMSQIRKAEEKVLRLALVNDRCAPGLADLVTTLPGVHLALLVTADSAESLIRRDSLDAVIVVAPDFQDCARSS